MLIDLKLLLNLNILIIAKTLLLLLEDINY
jgi:hypothetical protein